MHARGYSMSAGTPIYAIYKAISTARTNEMMASFLIDSILRDVNNIQMLRKLPTKKLLSFHHGGDNSSRGKNCDYS